ncbi:uncharacterized protein N7503_006152 [Penicillium pulvis]|uniref:uncharacterized protein n=1 Tax=Penicillium pulvis TaxID=1562058 RepID=UPI002549BA29|nr:uncharacterized protein N7503_006152 [Penicillium pulvis]KAJ5798647.1 hypothetical protein N7503_006152 [Penicillium pulvis]
MLTQTTSLFSLLFLTLSVLSPTKAEFLAAHAQITAAPIYHVLHPRQDVSHICDSGYTSCVGWEGCCPSGAACTVIDGQRGCDVACYGDVVCGHLCCNNGYACSANSFCVSSEYMVTYANVSEVVTTSTSSESRIETTGTSSLESSSSSISSMEQISASSTASASSSVVFSKPVSTSSSTGAMGSSFSVVGDDGTASGSSFGVPSSSGVASPTSSVLSSAQSTQTTLFSEASAVDRNSGVACMVALVLGIAL